ncbi:MAG: hypothetical protein RIC52_00115 [Amphiplicatus sp.]
MIKLLLAAIFGGLLSIAAAHACSCVWDENFTIEKHAASVDAIFSAEFLGSSRSDEKIGPAREGKFRVIESLKGDASSVAIVLYDRANGGNCGLTFKRKKVYHVYAHRHDEKKFVTNLCSGLMAPGDPTTYWQNLRKHLKG